MIALAVVIVDEFQLLNVLQILDLLQGGLEPARLLQEVDVVLQELLLRAPVRERTAGAESFGHLELALVLYRLVMVAHLPLLSMLLEVFPV